MTGLPGRVENLPKWAQREFEHFQRREAELRRDNDRLRAALAGNGGSPFRIERMGEEDIALPDKVQRITWQARDGFEVRLFTEDEDLKVMGTTFHALAVRPQSSNVVTIGRGRER